MLLQPRLLALLFLWPLMANASDYVYRYTPTCQLAYQHIMQLRLPAADSLLQIAQSKDPNNLIPVYLSNYIDFFRLYIHEDEEWYYSILDRKKERLRKLQQGDKQSPFYLFCQAEVRIQWAVARLKFGEYVGAFNDARKAYKLHQANLFLHPNFPLSKKSMGVLRAIIGAIPEEYQWGAELLGMEGTIDQGIEYLETLASSNDPLVQLYTPENSLLLAYLSLHLEKDTERAWALVNSNPLHPEDLLAHFVKANIAMYTGRNDAALQTITTAPRDATHEPFPFIDFMKGMVLARQLNQEAVSCFKAFLTHYAGGNYIKETYQKLAWLALIDNDTLQYKNYLSLVEEEGQAVIDPDKAALREAEMEEIPHPLLVEARLLFDGGYYSEAYALLQGKKRTDFTRLRDQLEFTYRAGRILQALDEVALAKGLFYATLKYNEDSQYYFAPGAALQLGLIFEAEGNYERAQYFYEKCRSFKGHAYASSLDSQAKAGLQRINR